MGDWNDKIIAEFRANRGKVGGPYEGAPLLLLHHTGARTGTERVNPMMYQAVGDGFAVFASKGGADTDPDWFHNLKAHPEARVEVGDETFDVVARVLDPRARAHLGEAEGPVPGVRRLRDEDRSRDPRGDARPSLTGHPRWDSRGTAGQR